MTNGNGSSGAKAALVAALIAILAVTLLVKYGKTSCGKTSELVPSEEPTAVVLILQP